jgi:hypothetical protein
MRRTAAALALALSPLLLTACGDKGTDEPKAEESATSSTGASSDAPEAPTASKAEFCAAQKKAVEENLKIAMNKKGDVAKLKAAYEEIKELGLPEGAPAEAEAGYEVAMSQAETIDWDEMAKDPMAYATKMSEEQDVSAADMKAAKKYGTWLVKECKLAG